MTFAALEAQMSGPPCPAPCYLRGPHVCVNTREALAELATSGRRGGPSFPNLQVDRTGTEGSISVMAARLNIAVNTLRCYLYREGLGVRDVGDFGRMSKLVAKYRTRRRRVVKR